MTSPIKSASLREPPKTPESSPNKKFVLKTPEKWYPITVSDENQLQVQFSPSTSESRARPCLYALRKTEVSPSHPTVTIGKISPSEKRQIGFTYRGAQVRTQEHLRKKFKDPTSHPFYADLEKWRTMPRESAGETSRMEVGIIESFPDGIPEGIFLEKLEERAIKESRHSLYNQQVGGGGITRREFIRRNKQKILTSRKLPIPTIRLKNVEGIFEPKKWYPCSTFQGEWISLKLPLSIALFHGQFIYVWRTKDDNRRLYGFSGQKTVAVRINYYFQEHSHKELLARIRKNPKNLEFSLVERVAHDQDPGDRERAYIEAFGTHLPEYGYNRNRGGGGARPMSFHFERSHPRAPMKGKYKIIPILLK